MTPVPRPPGSRLGCSSLPAALRRQQRERRLRRSGATFWSWQLLLEGHPPECRFDQTWRQYASCKGRSAAYDLRRRAFDMGAVTFVLRSTPTHEQGTEVRGLGP